MTIQDRQPPNWSNKEDPTLRLDVKTNNKRRTSCKTLMCAKPVLNQPNYNQTFTHLSTYASVFLYGRYSAQEMTPIY